MKPLQYQLENGLKVILMPSHAAPVVACNVWVGVGSADETAEQAGIAHVHEHMLFKGTERRGVGEIAASVEASGGQINAFTSNDFTCYYVVQSSRDFENVIDVLADAVCNSSFDAEELTRELEVIQEEIKRGKDNPGRVVNELLFEAAYEVHPYGKPVIGTKESVNSFKREDIVSFYKKHYVPSNCTVVLVGDFEIDAAKLLIKKHFGRFSGEVYQRVKRPEEPEQTKVRAVVGSKNISDNHLEIAFHIPENRHEDIPALKLLTTYLGFGESSRLYHQLHRELRLVSKIDSFCYNPRDSGLLSVSATYQLGKLNNGESATHMDVVHAIFKELFEMRSRTVSDRDLNRARTLLESQQVYGKQTVQGFAMRLGLNDQLTGDPNFEERFYHALRKVRSEDLRRVAVKYLKPSNCSVALLRSERSPEINARALGLLVQEASTNQEIEERETSSQVFFSLHGEPGDVIKCKLPNNIELVVQEDHSVETYSIYGVNFGGTRYETAETSGIGVVTQELMTAGTKTRTALEIADFMESKASFLQARSGRNTFSMESVGLSRFFEEGFECFADCWLNSTVPEDQFRLSQTEVLRQIKARKDSLTSVTFDALSQEMFAPHPYCRSGIGTSETVKRFTAESIRRQIADSARCDSMVLCVVGHVNADAVAEAAASFFSKATSSFVAPKIPLPKQRTEAKLVCSHLDKEQAYLSVGFGSANINDPLRYPGLVLRAILNGQGGRLFLELRDKQSLAYSVHATAITGIEASMLAINIGTSPKKVEQALRGIYLEIEKLCQDGVTEQEVARAKRYLAGNHDIGLQRNTTRARSFALDELYGLGYSDTIGFADRIEAVTMEQIDEYIRDYLKKEQSVASITTPSGVMVSPDLLTQVLGG